MHVVFISPWARYNLHVPRFLTWFKNAFGRTLIAFFPMFVSADDAFAERHLSTNEYQLYLTMDKRDRHHGCAVAKMLLRQAPQASPELLRAAFLHDVGKSLLPYNPWQRVLVHLVSPSRIAASPELTGLRRVWQVHLRHDRYGAQMIRATGGGERVAEIVSRHHAPSGDAEAAALKEVDEVY